MYFVGLTWVILVNIWSFGVLLLKNRQKHS
jgi:hypothetical protein